MSEIVNKKYIKRHKKGFIYFHWINAICFGVLFLTGLPLWVHALKPVYEALGPAHLQIIHRIFAVIFIANPIIALLFTAREGVGTLIREIFRFVASGLVMWLGGGLIDNSIRAWMIPLHSIAAGIGFAAAIGHIYLAIGVNPDSFQGMKDGTVKASYAEHHHTKWCDALVRSGKVSQAELDEAVRH